LPGAARGDGSAALLHRLRAQARGSGAAHRLEGALRPLRTVGNAVTRVAATLEELRDAGLLRERRVIEGAQGHHVSLDARSVLLLCSNDYLGLAGHPALRTAAAEAAQRWGAGAGASPLVSGHMALHRRLETELAAFKGAEACVLFGSGFLANTGVLAALAGRGDVILSDALNHASIVDGCRLSRAETLVYAHGDLDALADGLRQAGDRDAVIVTDAVFSMDGDLAPLQGIVELARSHGARVVVDEAHATGVVGSGGRGLAADLGLERDVDVVVGTLGKALGSYGAFACCNAQTADYLVNRARTLIYSTALPPPALGAALAALELLREQPEIVDRLHANARVLREELALRGFRVEPSTMPIIPILVGDPGRAMALCEEALRRGVFAQAIRPPTVPDGTSRLRAVAMACHDERDLRDAARILAVAARELGLDAVAPAA
jgi:glycine C-acetyltransferase/8-amino-7-oxononanoate synthase